MSPYLNRPLRPLTVALPQMLAQIQAELAGKNPEPAEQERLHQRAELIRGLLTLNPKHRPNPG
jgi:hypothetical protein